ncbi:unnamed protein product [Notodromas monacha]|uniref:Methyltransferase FkbM domain-containing protein n=1 Tax=Notodromas monacha TaxID=399045 RepID=A0A7R9GIX2_9CRUS|nr:unnamed protein product [Notodromas monacha]CAG0922265.1 unnamed protein product [Notodromas monacha]
MNKNDSSASFSFRRNFFRSLLRHLFVKPFLFTIAAISVLVLMLFVMDQQLELNQLPAIINIRSRQNILETSELTQQIRAKLMDNRNGSSGSLKLSKPVTGPENADRSQVGQPKILQQYFKNKTGGTFVEAGAFDGEEMSNTLYLETMFNWTGLLVEANPSQHSRLVAKNRRVAALQGCISPSGQPSELQDAKKLMRPGQSLNFMPLPSSNDPSVIFCYPLLNILASADLLEVDVLFLDVDGAEPEILETLPFEDTNIKALVVECWHNGSLVPTNCTATTERIKATLKPWGYELREIINNQDLLFMKKDAN